MQNLAVQMNNGELTLSGSLSPSKMGELNNLISQLKAIPGVRLVKNFITELPQEATMVNISDKYTITGYSQRGNSINVVINGKILSRGDLLDGMTITSIQSNAILLEKDGVKYRIDYSK